MCVYVQCMRFFMVSIFGPKVGQTGTKWDKSCVFFRSDFSRFWLAKSKCTAILSEIVQDLSHLVPIGFTLESNMTSLTLTTAEGNGSSRVVVTET